MKRIVTLCFFMAMAFTSAAQKQDKYDAELLIQFHGIHVTFINDFIIDSSGRKYGPSYIKSPFKEERFAITGPYLKLFLTDQIKDNRNTSISSWLRDSSKADTGLFSLKNTEIKITSNQQISAEWKAVTDYPLYKDTAATKTGQQAFLIALDSFHINDSMLFELRDKLHPGVLFKIHFTRISLPVQPFLAMMMHDSSATTTATDFIKRAIETKNREFESINSFYKNWPAKYGAGQNNSQYFPTSKLAFYFRKPTLDFPDNSLEYKVTGGGNTDAIWHRSSHLILIPKLQPNSHYTLFVRYAAAPENVWKTSFYVVSEWYQTTTFYMICIAILCGLSGFIFYKEKLRKEKRKIIGLQLEQRAVRSQLNPHFTFNALSSIQSLMNQNKITEANYYFTEFSSLLRDSMRHNEKEMLPLKTELQTLESYIKLEQLRFRFSYNIAVEPTIDTSTVEIPSLLLQPLVENAIKHGISQLHEQGKIGLAIEAKGKDLVITIQDNGKGFLPQEPTGGYGLSLTKERIKLMNLSLTQQKIAMTINSNATGTIVFLSFESWL